MTSQIIPATPLLQARGLTKNFTVGKTMMPKYFTHNNSCGFFTSDFFSTGHEMCHLSISIYHC